MPILVIWLVFLNKHSLGTSAFPIYPMQKTQTKSWSPLPNLFHRVTGNPKHTLIFFRSCMHVSFTSCIYKHIFDLPNVWKNIWFSTDRHSKIPSPSPPSLIKLLVSNKENKWVGRHVTPIGHINEYSNS